ncbi:MAG: malto-oligosyltrehalose synthase [Thermomicrobiales bacterium]
MDEVRTQRSSDQALVDSVVARMTPAQAPIATYRVQFNAGFTFKDAERIVPYLASLGVSALYASPIFKAAPGSMHGYDVTDYGSLNPEIGTDDEFRALVAALQRQGLGLVLDFVPNHMGIADGANSWWLDVLENGQTSSNARVFDIDWQPLKAELRNKVLIPFLREHYGVVLERGEITLKYENGVFTAWYFDQPLPIAPPTYPFILGHALGTLVDGFHPEALPLLEYQSILTAFDRLPANNERDPDRVAERQREQIVAKRRLADSVNATPEIAEALEETLRWFNGRTSETGSVDAIDTLLEQQSYRVAYWRTAAEEINYRRFFAINELAAIRQEIPEVFVATHRLLMQLIGQGAVTGVRIDHPDGLWDPAGYFAKLQCAAFLARARAIFDADPPRAARNLSWADLEPEFAAWWEQHATDAEQWSIYLVVEKILERGEELPADWAVHGTVGYEFVQAATEVFVDPSNRKTFDDLYARFISGERQSFADVVYESKQLIMRVALASEINVLAWALNRISEQHRRTRDFTLNSLRFAIGEVIACFPVYRTYLTCDEEKAKDRDRRVISQALNVAKRRNPASDPSVFDFVRDVLLGTKGEVSERQRGERCRFGMKVQQLTGPVMAKGLEDTAFYVYNRLTSLNEVGGDPAIFGLPLVEFHQQNAERLRHWPAAMISSSTHDTKRSEDVRARIDLLSELPREWRASINRWSRLNRRHKTRVDGTPAPDRNDEYLFYQTLLGAWPFNLATPDSDLIDRMEAYMLKAIHEAQVHTSWINPNTAYDEATAAFVRTALRTKGINPFLDDFTALRDRVAQLGIVNSLAQQLLKLTSPGVSDLYQGTELWDFSLVDPDNRRPVDFTVRHRLLRELRRRKPERLVADLWQRRADGAIKLYVTHRALACRHADPELYRRGDYLPLATTGRQADHICAFARRLDGRETIVAVPRLVATLTRDDPSVLLTSDLWGDSRIGLPDLPEDAQYRDAFTDKLVPLSSANGDAFVTAADLFSSLPVALLARQVSPDE